MFVKKDDEQEIRLVSTEQANLLWISSWCSLASSIYAFRLRHYKLGSGALIVYATSLLYWRNPTHSWRRVLDMFCVHATFFYHLYKVAPTSYMKTYYSRAFIIVMLYPCSLYLHRKRLSWWSVYAHALLHVLGNGINIQMYQALHRIERRSVSFCEKMNHG